MLPRYPHFHYRGLRSFHEIRRQSHLGCLHGVLVMIRIHQISGKEVASLDEHGVRQVTETHGNSVIALKRHLRTICDVPIYRFRLVRQGEVLRDEHQLNDLSAPTELQMTIHDFTDPDEDQIKRFLKAAEDGETASLEAMLHAPMNPNQLLPDDPDSDEPNPNLAPHLPRFVRRNRHAGISALQLAAQAGHLECARILIDAGAIINRENWLGETPLHLCCKLGHWEVAELLVEAKASADTADLRGTTPIETACTNGFDNIVRVLLHAGATKPPLSLACQQANGEVVQLLIGARADKSEEDRDGKTPLLVATSQGHVEVVKVLINAGVCKDKVDRHGRSPLWMAADHDKLEVARFLIKAGVQKDQIDAHGRSPLWIAANHGNVEIVELLIKARADKGKLDREGKSPLSIAKYRSHLDVVELLSGIESRAVSPATKCRRQE
ncbi:unnamed protein product [Durusdinium trenchii]|uniref:Ubiquitin-like domain-containing protein n=1 Tax=Durusdinium trenchii TaxID=1381693 RepID=A0ABP0L1W0_9DINO